MIISSDKTGIACHVRIMRAILVAVKVEEISRGNGTPFQRE
jgi:hypothetical protein